MLQKKLPKDEIEEDVEITTHKKKYISPEERQQIIDESRLVPKKMYISKHWWWIKVNVKRKKQQIINKLSLV